MHLWEASLLGLVQGVTEFLPISSSAHLTLLPQILHWKTPLLNSVAFEVALHVGTLAAVVGYFWYDLVAMLKALLHALVQPRLFSDLPARLGLFIILGTLPAVAAALFLGDWIQGVFRQPEMVVGCLLGFSFIMLWAESVIPKSRILSDMHTWDACLIGCVQALALMPGISRSGSTIAAGLLLHFQRESAARFAFLLSVPAILGAVVFHMRDLVFLLQGPSWITLGTGTITAAVTGYAAIHFLLAYLRQRTLYVFILYRFVLGTAVLAWLLWHQ